MPIYEYRCKVCNRSFEEIRSISEADKPIVCKHCHSTDTVRCISKCYSKSAGGSASSASSGGCSGCTSHSCSGCGH